MDAQRTILIKNLLTSEAMTKFPSFYMLYALVARSSEAKEKKKSFENAVKFFVLLPTLFLPLPFVLF